MEIRNIAAEVRSTDSKNRTVEFIISDATKDRHGTIISPAGWQLENYNRAGIVGYQHNVHGAGLLTEPNPDNVLGSGFAYLEGDKLIGRVTFEPESINPLAEKIFQKVLLGTLKAASVGFNPIKQHRDEDGTIIFDEVDLLEWSIVNVPSNPGALKRSTENNKGLTPYQIYARRILLKHIN